MPTQVPIKLKTKDFKIMHLSAITASFELQSPTKVCEGQGYVTACVVLLNRIERGVEVDISAVQGTAIGESQ